MQSIFTEKKKQPSAKDLVQALGKTSILWNNLVEFTVENSPGAKPEWNYSGEKYGWSFRIKDNKRAIVYLLPRDGFFKAALVFGDKALAQIFASSISDSIKNELNAARKYAEGKGIRIDVRKNSDLEEIKKLVLIKISR